MSVSASDRNPRVPGGASLKFLRPTPAELCSAPRPVPVRFRQAVAGFLTLLLWNSAHSQSDAASPPTIDLAAVLEKARGVAGSGLTVDYDPTADIVSIRAHHAPLVTVITEVSRKVGFVLVLPRAGLDEPVSVELNQLPLQVALRHLLQRFSSTFVYEPEARGPEGDAVPRLVRVVVLQREATRTPTARPGHREYEPSSQLLPTDVDSILRALTSANAESARQTLTALSLSMREHEWKTLVAALFNRLDNGEFPPDEAVLAALHELEPELAIRALSDLLRQADARRRVLAAGSLGRLRDERAVDALESALNDEALIRQAAASSLALIGADRSREALLRAYLAGDDRVRYAVAIAIISHGDTLAQEALRRLVPIESVLSAQVPDPHFRNPNVR